MRQIFFLLLLILFAHESFAAFPTLRDAFEDKKERLKIGSEAEDSVEFYLIVRDLLSPVEVPYLECFAHEIGAFYLDDCNLDRYSYEAQQILANIRVNLKASMFKFLNQYFEQNEQDFDVHNLANKLVHHAIFSHEEAYREAGFPNMSYADRFMLAHDLFLYQLMLLYYYPWAVTEIKLLFMKK